MPQVSQKMKAVRRQRRKYHIRKRVNGTPERPRLSIFRSLCHTYVQLIDDVAGRTLCAASTVEKDLRTTLAGTGNRSAAEAIGQRIAERAKAVGVTKVVGLVHKKQTE